MPKPGGPRFGSFINGHSLLINGRHRRQSGLDGIRRTAMTPQEQQLVADLFNRLASLEGQRRDPDAERLIREGLGRAPNSVYALVQTVLIQDETLKRANARIEELERAAAAPAESGSGGSFLDGVRNMFGGREQPRGSVPSVQPGGGQGSSGVWGPRPGAGPVPSQPSPGQPSGQPWGNPQGYPQGYPSAPPPGYAPAGYPPAGAPMGGGGGSFLGTAAATVAGVVGGAMLLNGIRSMMGGHEGFSPGHDPSGGMTHGGSPWDSGSHGGSGQVTADQGNDPLSRDAGLNDIGGGHRTAAWDHTGNADDNNDTGGGFLGGNVDDLAGDTSGDFDTSDYDDGGDGGDGGDFDTA
jgi:hypothetical protein